MSADAVSRWFYCKDYRVTGTGRYSASVFQINRYPMAQLRTAAPQERGLIAADHQHTVGVIQESAALAAATYTAFGYRRAALGHDPALGFTGQWLDSASGSYLLGKGYRAYSPVLMRFASCDSLSPFGRGGINGYSYCGGDPVNYVDPSGHFALLTAFGAMLGVGIASLGSIAGMLSGSRRAQQLAALSSVTALAAGANVRSKAGPVLAGSSIALAVKSVKVAVGHAQRADAVQNLKPITNEVLIRAGLPAGAESSRNPASLAEMAAVAVPGRDVGSLPAPHHMKSRQAGRILRQGPQNVRFAQQFVAAQDKVRFLEAVEQNPGAFEVEHLSQQLRESL